MRHRLQRHSTKTPVVSHGVRQDLTGVRRSKVDDTRLEHHADSSGKSWLADGDGPYSGPLVDEVALSDVRLVKLIEVWRRSLKT